jgi:hypothetical protein
MNALLDSKIKFVTTRHEQGVLFGRPASTGHSRNAPACARLRAGGRDQNEPGACRAIERQAVCDRSLGGRLRFFGG